MNHHCVNTKKELLAWVVDLQHIRKKTVTEITDGEELMSVFFLGIGFFSIGESIQCQGYEKDDKDMLFGSDIDSCSTVNHECLTIATTSFY